MLERLRKEGKQMSAYFNKTERRILFFPMHGDRVKNEQRMVK